MSNRWKVEQEADWLNGTYWIAWQPKKGWKSIAPKFHTHGEAMAYADHRARTITVTLPRPQGKKRIECTTHPSPYQVYAQGVNGYGGVGTVTSPYGHIYFCDAGDMEAVALYLLALARKGGSGGA